MTGEERGCGAEVRLARPVNKPNAWDEIERLFEDAFSPSPAQSAWPAWEELEKFFKAEAFTATCRLMWHGQGPPPSLEDLLKAAEPVYHPAQDYIPGVGLVYGAPVARGKHLFLLFRDPRDGQVKLCGLDYPGDRKIFEVRLSGDKNLKFEVPAGFRGALNPDALLKAASEAYGSGGFRDVPDPVEVFKTYVEFPDKRLYAVFEALVRGTYLHRAFPAYPYGWLTGAPGTGKTKTTIVMSLMSFNGYFNTDLTAADLYTIIGAARGTLGIDEAAGLDRADREIVQVIAAGFTAGVKIPRILDAKEREIAWFEPYGPKIINGLEPLAVHLVDRSIQVVMEEAKDPKVKDAWPPGPNDPLWPELRAKLMLWALRVQDDVIAAYRAIRASPPGNLHGRSLDIFAPLLAVAEVLGPAYYNAVLSFAVDYAREKRADLAMALDYRVLEALVEMKEAGYPSVMPFKALRDEITTRIGEDLSYQRLAHILRCRLKVLKREPYRKAGVGMIYQIDWEAVERKLSLIHI